MPTEEMAGMVDDNFPTRMLTRERDRFVIGRDNDCAIVVRDASLSRQHCYLIVEADGSYKIVDMNSTNGTYVKQGGDWVKIGEAAVSTKDLVKLGILRSPDIGSAPAAAGKGSPRFAVTEGRHFPLL